MRKPPVTLYLFTALAALIGGWMIFDGLHNRMFGDFVRIGSQLGPWSVLPQAIGIDPLEMGFFFVVVGLEWIAATAGLWLGRRWGYNLGILLSLLTLFYAFIGTGFAVLALAMLLLKPTREWVSSP